MKKLSVLLALLLCLTLCLPALAEPPAPPTRVLGLIGPTGMSLAPMIRKADAKYQISLAASPEELVGTIVSGNYDIAAVPTNMAALLYQRTKGELQLLAINTLGVLYVLEKGETVKAPADLAGKTLTLSGQGAVPVGTGGVVRDDAKRLAALEGVMAAARELGFEVLGHAESPIEGPAGNREWLLGLAARSAPPPP